MNSIVASLLRTRTHFLKQGIIALITDPELQAQFLSHPLIKLVRAPMIAPGTAALADAQALADEMQRAPITRLTHIDPAIFARVLTSLITEKAQLSLFGPLLLTADALPDSPQKRRILHLILNVPTADAALSELSAAIYELPADYQPHLFAALEPVEARLREMSESAQSGGLLPLLEGILRVNDDAFRRALRVIIGTARSLDEAQAQIEHWFTSTMAQVSTLFQRRMTQFTIVIGLVLALVLNVDALHMAETLWNEPALREAVSAAAGQAVQSGELQRQIEAGRGSEEAAVGVEIAAFEAQLRALLALNLPIGWGMVVVEGGCFLPEGQAAPPACASARNLWAVLPGNSPDWLGLVVKKVIGLLVTVIAVAQGAPFWFDLLRRLVAR